MCVYLGIAQIAFDPSCPLYGTGTLGHFFGSFTTTSMLRTTLMNYFLTGSIFRPLPWAGQTCRGSCRSCLCNTHWGQAGLESQEKWETIKIEWMKRSVGFTIESSINMIFGSLLWKYMSFTWSANCRYDPADHLGRNQLEVRGTNGQWGSCNGQTCCEQTSTCCF